MKLPRVRIVKVLPPTDPEWAPLGDCDEKEVAEVNGWDAAEAVRRLMGDQLVRMFVVW